MGKQQQIFFFSPRPLLNGRVEKASIVLPTLLRMPINFLVIVIEGIELLGNILPLIPRISMLPEYPKGYF